MKDVHSKRVLFLDASLGSDSPSSSARNALRGFTQRVFLVALLVVGTVLLMGQTSPERIVEAEKFILVDSDGNQRAWLGSKEDGVFLILKDAAGKPRIKLSVDPDVSRLHFFDSNGVQRAVFEVSPQEQGIIYMDEQTREKRMLIRESPTFSLFDQYGVERVAARVMVTGSMVATYDVQGELKDAIGLPPRYIPLKYDPDD